MHRFCELIDPSCAQYDTRYLDVIVREARWAGEDSATRLMSDHQTGFSKPTIDEGETIVIPFDCCGGGMPPGIFDEP